MRISTRQIAVGDNLILSDGRRVIVRTVGRPMGGYGQFSVGVTDAITGREWRAWMNTSGSVERIAL